MYIAPINETITLFRNNPKGREGEISSNFLRVKNKLVQKTIVDEINENTNFDGIEITPFSNTTYTDLDDMLRIVKDECKKEGKRYIYTYDTEPDHTMHDFGSEDEQVKKLIKIRNDKVEKLCNELQNTIIIIIADHGHRLVEPI